MYLSEKNYANIAFSFKDRRRNYRYCYSETRVENKSPRKFLLAVGGFVRQHKNCAMSIYTGDKSILNSI